MQIALNQIKVKRRVRNDTGDVEPLMDSMRHYGLLNPITITNRYVLIAGRRRLEAARKLGWTSINAIILDNTDKISELEIEIEENTQRTDFSDKELMEAYARLEKLRNPGFFRRIWNAIVSFFKKLFFPNSD